VNASIQYIVMAGRNLSCADYVHLSRSRPPTPSWGWQRKTWMPGHLTRRRAFGRAWRTG